MKFCTGFMINLFIYCLFFHVASTALTGDILHNKPCMVFPVGAVLNGAASSETAFTAGLPAPFGTSCIHVEVLLQST